MRYQYILRITGAEPAEIGRVLGKASSDDAGDWSLVLDEGPNDPPTPFVDVFFRVLEGRFGALEQVGVARNDITVWVLYEYDQQCNLEFPATDLERLGNAGISLCVSCWQAPG